MILETAFGIISGLLTPEQAFSGFSSTATITVAAMFVLSAGLLRTGALENISGYMVRYAGHSERRMYVLMALFIPIVSAFINNTPVVVMMIPILLSVCRRLDLQPSKLMIPLSYLSILGGTATLLGTSTNILVDDLYRKAGREGFGLFEFAPLAILLTGIGFLYLILVGRDLLPNRAPLSSLVTNRRRTPYITELSVVPTCPLIGKPVATTFKKVSSVSRSATEQFTVTFAPRRRRLSPSLSQKKSEQSSANTNSTQLRETDEDGIELLAIYRNERAYLAEDVLGLAFQENDQIVVAGTP